MHAKLIAPEDDVEPAGSNCWRGLDLSQIPVVLVGSAMQAGGQVFSSDEYLLSCW